MSVPAAVWTIKPEVFESMLRMWFKHTRSHDDPDDLRLVDVALAGGDLVALVELIGVRSECKNIKKFIDKLVDDA